MLACGRFANVALSLLLLNIVGFWMFTAIALSVCNLGSLFDASTDLLEKMEALHVELPTPDLILVLSLATQAVLVVYQPCCQPLG